MRVLAVIPARAGSRGIPNKNIRIINEHPLVYYSIYNAIKSECISDVVVSTDSHDVRIIAQQMGVCVHWREESLCSDEVTLDAVVADAIPTESEWDYIVTMQPTSPTLRVDTLDSAIRYTIDNKLDTVISVTNSPHLSWVEKNGVKIPNYSERLNRQYLPPYYVETGAFVISKSTVVTSFTRIGDRVDVFEVPEDESQDVDTFEDLRSVAMLLSKPRVGIYVNGNRERGVGHVYRALEIADEFFVKPDILFDTNQTNPKVFGNTKHTLVPVNGIAELFQVCKQKEYTIFINDILSTSIDYMIGLKTVLPEAKIINFEDDGEGAIEADLVFNALLYQEPFSNIKAGEKYYISGKTFMYYNPIRINDVVKRVFISFGGADPQNYTDRLLSIICKPEYQKYSFVVVLGRAKQNVSDLLEYNNNRNIEVFFDVSNMPELMTSCDIGITSRGRTGYELAMLGIPAIAMAQNKREEKHGFICSENGFSYIGLNPTNEIIESTLQMYLKLGKESRKEFQDHMLSHDLRGGRKRVMNLINTLL